MAEVKLNIIAEDRASEIFKNIVSAFDKLKSSIATIDGAGKTLSGGMDVLTQAVNASTEKLNVLINKLSETIVFLKTNALIELASVFSKLTESTKGFNSAITLARGMLPGLIAGLKTVSLAGASFFAGWKIGEWISGLEAGGRTIHQWTKGVFLWWSEMLDGIVRKVKTTWAELKITWLEGINSLFEYGKKLPGFIGKGYEELSAMTKSKISELKGAVERLGEEGKKSEDKFRDMYRILEEESIKSKEAFEDTTSAVKQATENISKAMTDSMTALNLEIDPSAIKGIEELNASITGLKKEIETPYAFCLDVSQAVKAVSEVNSAIASIPDVTVKTVILQYQTQASPLMPFTKGIDHIKELMESLP
jgi:methyl-accepting chemotaxis protein